VQPIAEGISEPTPEHEYPFGPSEVTLAAGPGVKLRHGAIEVTEAGTPRTCPIAGNTSATTAAMYHARFIGLG
jgi:hypothetical protein